MTTAGGDSDRELDALLETIFRTYHHDFRQYVRASLRRRVEHGRSELRCSSLGELSELVAREPVAFDRLLRQLTIQVSEFFRDPRYWRALRESVVPHLATYPFLRLWVAGCGAGEEAYSLAIVLAEEGLLERSQIYATDIDAGSLEDARAGVFELERVQRFSQSYFAAGGKLSLSEYYTTGSSTAAFVPELRNRILFSDHSLATDSAFAEVQLVSCRNVLIYFDRVLQDRAVGIFAEALCPLGFLGLGDRESLLFSAHALRFEPFVGEQRIYRKREGL